MSHRAESIKAALVARAPVRAPRAAGRVGMVAAARCGRGLTLIEVVVAVATLVIAAGALLGGSSFVSGLAARDRLRVDAAEAAHRVIIQHIEDPNFWRTQPKRVEMGGRYFAFTLEEEVVTAPDQAGASGRVNYATTALASAQTEQALKSLNRLLVRVYPDDDFTGTQGKIAAAEISRCYVWISMFDQDDVFGEVGRRFGRQIDQSGLGGPGGR